MNKNQNQMVLHTFSASLENLHNFYNPYHLSKIKYILL